MVDVGGMLGAIGLGGMGEGPEGIGPDIGAVTFGGG